VFLGVTVGISLRGTSRLQALPLATKLRRLAAGGCALIANDDELPLAYGEAKTL